MSGRSIVQAGDHSWPIQDIVIDEHHEPIIGHQVAIELTSALLAQGVPTSALEFDQSVEAQ